MNAYEELRRQAVQPDGCVGSLKGCGVLIRCGLAAWAELGPSAVATRPPEPLCELPPLASTGTELIRLVASLILTTRQENFPHA